MRTKYFLLLTLLLTFAAAPPAAAPESTPPTGTQTLTFTERSPLSTLKDLAKRLNEKTLTADYALADQPFAVHVAPTYSKSKPAGLLVLLNYKDTPAPPAQPVLDLLAKHNLIFVAPIHANLEALQTAGLALDAVHNLSKTYAVDPARIYMFDCNHNGTGARLALCYPEIFTGSFLDNSYAYRPIPLGGNRTLPSHFPPPTGLTKAKGNGFLLAELRSTDADQIDYRHRQQKAFTADGFRHVKVVNVTADQLHYPNWTTDWLEDALTFFEAIPPTPRPKPTSSPTTKPTTRKS